MSQKKEKGGDKMIDNKSYIKDRINGCKTKIQELEASLRVYKEALRLWQIELIELEEKEMKVK